MPEITAAAYRLSALKSFLSDQGHEVHIITTHPHRSPQEQPLKSSPGITRVSMPKIEGSTSGRIKEQLWFMFQSFFAFVIKPSQYDYVIASSPPLFAGFSGFLISKLCGARFILDVRDIWPGSIIATGIFSSESVPIRLASLLEHFLYRKAYHITTVANPMASYIKQFKEEHKVTIIYNGVDQLTTYKVIDPPKTNSEPLNLIYAGNLGLVQGLDLLIRAVSRLDEKRRNRLRVRFLGQGLKQDELEKLSAELKVDSVVSFSGPYNKNELDKIIANQAHALFIHLISDPSLNLTIPSKVFDCLQYNIPIVYGLAGEAHDILDKQSGNIAFQQGSENDLKRALEKLIDDYYMLHDASAGNRTYVKDHFMRSKCFEPLLNVIGSNK